MLNRNSQLSNAIEMIILDFQLYSIVNDEDFKKFLKITVRNIISDNVFSNTTNILKWEREYKKKIILNDLNVYNLIIFFI